MTLEGVRLVVRQPCAVCEGTGRGESEYTGLGTELPQPCGNCDSSGKVDVELAVEDLTAHILGHVRRPVIAEDDLNVVADDLRTALVLAAQRSQGLADAEEAGQWLRVCQEAAEALRSVAELRPRPGDAP